jgi:hypothetical protein
MTFLKLIPNTDAQQFTEKINHDKIPTLIPEKTQYYVDPLSDIYFTTPDYDTQQPLPYINQSNVQLLYIRLVGTYHSLLQLYQHEPEPCIATAQNDTCGETDGKQLEGYPHPTVW